MRARLVLAVLLIAGPAAADVTIRSKVDSGGFKGMGAFAGTTTRYVQGERAREESDIDFKGRLMRAVTAARNGIEIVRVDLDKIWLLQPKKKTYTERTVTLPPPEKEEKASEPAGKPGPEEKPTHRIKKSEFTVKKTGEKKTLNGFSTEKNEVRLLVEVEEIASKEVTSYDFTTDVWATPWTADLRKAAAEEARFSQAYAAKLGLKLSPEQRQFDPRLVAVMLGVEPAKAEETLAQTRKKIESINGFPILTEARWTVKEDANAVARRKAEKAKAAEPEETGVDLSGGASGVAGNLLGNFAKKKARENQEKKEAAREALPLYSSSLEIVSVDVAPVAADRFEVPAGFKKVAK